MNERRWIWVPVIGFLLWTGCVVRSVQPYYNEKDRVKVPDLEGGWTLVRQSGSDVSDQGIPDWNFSETTMVCFDENRRPGVLETGWFKVNGGLFIDFFPGDAEENSANTFWASLLFPMHVLCRVDQKGDSLFFVPIDYDWLTKKIKGKSKSWGISTIDSQDEDFFNASPERWTSWLAKHGQDPDAFNLGNALVFRRSR